MLGVLVEVFGMTAGERDLYAEMWCRLMASRLPSTDDALMASWDEYVERCSALGVNYMGRCGQLVKGGAFAGDHESVYVPRSEAVHAKQARHLGSAARARQAEDF